MHLSPKKMFYSIALTILQPLDIIVELWQKSLYFQHVYFLSTYTVYDLRITEKYAIPEHMALDFIYKRLTLEPCDNVSQFCARLVCMSWMLSFSDLVDISDITKET